MKTILFTSEGHPLKPALAAACIKAFRDKKVCAAVAAGSRECNDPNVLKLMAAEGLQWPAVILPFAGLELFSYDLVVCFADKTGSAYPALPGNPVLVYWNLPDPPLTRGERLDAAACRRLLDQIRGLTDDLLRQGYLDALVQARKNSELILDNLHEGIIAHDLKRRIFFFNRAAEQITGFSRSEVLGRDCHEAFSEGFCKSKCSFCDLGTVPVLPQRSYPLVLKSKHGDDRRIEMSVVPIKDFLSNPVGIVASFRDLTKEFELVSRLEETESFAGIIGRDPAMQELFRTIKDLADSSAPVLIQGESGTGKELVAAAIHNKGSRADRLFVPVNCGALPENLLETELFGHVKGAFTGAIRDKKGRFELADGGTIFLDEIGDITPAMQVKLLRVLQDGAFQRVGGEKTIRVNVRIISATNKDLREEIKQGRFREDLYYRLCVVPLLLPPLRERRNDIPLLARHFLKRVLAEEGREEMIISPETMDIFMTYDWPGNIRELQNIIRYILVRCRGDLARPQHLPPNILQHDARSIRVAAPRGRRGLLDLDGVRRAIGKAGGNRVKAARLLGVSRATLYRFLAKHPVE